MSGAVSCRYPGKIRHTTQAEAQRHADGLKYKRGASPDLMPYRCGDHWHVGHSAESLRRRLQRATAGIRGRRRRSR